MEEPSVRRVEETEESSERRHGDVGDESFSQSGNKMKKRLMEGMHERTIETIENEVRGEAMEILRIKEMARDEMDKLIEPQPW